MKIFADENIPLITVDQLREQGHDVIDIRGTAEQGITDEKLWQKAQAEKSLLITTDKGFASYREKFHYGILIIRLRQPTRMKIHNHIIQTIKKYPPAEWPGLMVVVRDVVQSSWKSRNSKK